NGRPSIKAQDLIERIGDKLALAARHAVTHAPAALAPYRQGGSPILMVVFSAAEGAPGGSIVRYTLGADNRVSLEPLIDIDHMTQNEALFADPAALRY